MQDFLPTIFLLISSLVALCTALLARRYGHPLLIWAQISGILAVIAEQFLPLGLASSETSSLWEVAIARVGSLALISTALVVTRAKGPTSLITGYQSAIIYLAALAFSDLVLVIVWNLTGTIPLELGWVIAILGMVWLTAAGLETRRFNEKRPLKWLRLLLTAAYFALGTVLLVALVTVAGPLYGRIEDPHGPMFFNTLALTYLAPALLFALVAWKGMSLSRFVRLVSMWVSLVLGGYWVGLEVAYQKFGGDLAVVSIETINNYAKRGIGKEVLQVLPEFGETVPALGLDDAAEMALLHSIETGDARGAAWRLGEMYRTGDGVQPNGEASAYWLRLAAEAGHASAAHVAGELYMRGVLVPVDYAEALRFFEMAGEDWGPSRLLIGDIYAQGLGVGKDDEAARVNYCFATQDTNSKHDAFARLGLILPKEGTMQFDDYWNFEARRCGDVIAQIRASERARVDAYRLNSARKEIPERVLLIGGLAASCVGFVVGWRRKRLSKLRNPTILLLALPSVYVLSAALYFINWALFHQTLDTYLVPVTVGFLIFAIIFVAGPLALFPFFAYRRKASDHSKQ